MKFSLPTVYIYMFVFIWHRVNFFGQIIVAGCFGGTLRLQIRTIGEFNYILLFYRNKIRIEILIRKIFRKKHKSSRKYHRKVLGFFSGYNVYMLLVVRFLLTLKSFFLSQVCENVSKNYLALELHLREQNWIISNYKRQKKNKFIFRKIFALLKLKSKAIE